ncbi:MAG TPA: N-acetylglucosamine-6-phosphate deacetylase [Albidovulum sp.]|uniref:N-acetylglucosamine-6-phosphate deacetylase n=1 Tax=Albidovulum sp. TaxID=1872424 RepID=UPI002BC743B5|nr:N-acetylglucosamine-6-phosphate deacetylase [Albidovulum sp.]
MALHLTGARIFDGENLGPGDLLIEGGEVAALLPAGSAVPGAEVLRLSGGIFSPGFVDLQINGGGGLMLNDRPELATVEMMAAANAGLGALTILPTLITDTPEVTRRAVEAVAGAVAKGVPGIAGLHLEGPHLSLARKGAHDPALIRPMAEADLGFLQNVARRLPRLLVTLAPESVTPDQIARLAGAGIIVSLGHSDCSYDAARAAIASGAHVATHLFNAMSPLGNREPGLVGAVLDDGRISAGLIADAVHVHPAAIRSALAAKRGPGEIFLVTDAMAPAGTDLASFTLNGRTIRREDGRLTLADGTLAGADLDFPRALRVLRDAVGVPLDQTLRMATLAPARVIGLQDRCGRIGVGRRADLVHLSDGLELQGIWQGGQALQLSPGLAA